MHENEALHVHYLFKYCITVAQQYKIEMHTLFFENAECVVTMNWQ